MKLLIIVIVAMWQHTGFASFKVSAVATQAFAPQRFKNGLFNKLPPVQQEILLSLLSHRPLLMSDVDIMALAKQTSLLLPAEKKSYLRQEMATKRGYQQQLKVRKAEATYGLIGARAIFSLNNIWKVNLLKVMPNTAALTDEDLPAAADAFQELDTSVRTVLDLVAAGHEDIVETFKNSDHKQSRSILFEALKSWHHEDSEEILVQKFSQALESKRKFLQERVNWYDINNTVLEQEVAEMESIAALEVLTDKAEAISTFYAEQDVASYDYYIEEAEVLSHEVVIQKLTSGGDDSIVATAIADLGLDGYMALATVSSLTNSHENIFTFLELAKTAASPTTE